MVSIFMMQSMPIHPGDRIDIDPKCVIHDGDECDEPFLIVEGTMRDSQMKNIGQIQPGEKPAEDKINSADQQSGPSSQVSWGGIHTSQHVEKNYQIAGDVVDFHDDPAWGDSSKNESSLQVTSQGSCYCVTCKKSCPQSFCCVMSVAAHLVGVRATKPFIQP
jgi:hypothetical protein